ncbi:MAG: phosphate acyltransferase PlsX, partial [Synechococcaceae bacterium WB9_4xC_028]|nr:phosphate acyltransferase PlsX [Synechococcaceae bacterium WB9_4xC_028]
MPPKDPDSAATPSPRTKPRRSRAVRRLVIWYRRNAAVTSLVDTATTSASAAGTAAGNVAGSVGSMAGSMLQPLVFDPLRRLQGGGEGSDQTIDDRDRLWVAVDGMGGDHAPGPILEGCLEAIERLPLRIRFVGETDRVLQAAAAMELSSALERAIAAGTLELVPSGASIGMDDEATAVRRKRDASINVAMDLVKKGEALAVYSAGNSGAVMASAIFRLGRLAGIDRPAIGALFPTKDPGQPVLVLDVGANMDCKPAYLHQFALLGNIYSR